MTMTPAKILKTPDADLSEMEEADLQKLAGGVVKRTIKLMLEASEGAAEGWGEPVLAFLRASSHIGVKHPIVATAMVGLFDKDGPAGGVSKLVELAGDVRDEDGVREFLKLLRGELMSGDADRATAFKAKAENLEGSLQGK